MLKNKKGLFLKNFLSRCQYQNKKLCLPTQFSVKVLVRLSSRCKEEQQCVYSKGKKQASLKMKWVQCFYSQEQYYSVALHRYTVACFESDQNYFLARILRRDHLVSFRRSTNSTTEISSFSLLFNQFHQQAISPQKGKLQDWFTVFTTCTYSILMIIFHRGRPATVAIYELLCMRNAGVHKAMDFS